MRLAVVGDCLLDIDIVGSASRLCPDAPVPVVDVAEERVRAGGAGLAARLAAADGVDVTLVTSIAGDDDGELLRTRLAGLHVVAAPAACTTAVKTRLLCGNRSIARLDRGGRGGPPAVTGDMLEALRTADAVLVSDYGRGVTADRRLRAALSQLAGEVPVVWDPHPRGTDPVAGAAAVTPNLAEAVALSGIEEPGYWLEAASVAGAELIRRWAADAVTVTVGPHGALVCAGGTPNVVPADRVSAGVDTCGAGDRFAAALATRLMTGAALADAVAAAVHTCGRFLAEGGVGSIHNGQPAVEDAQPAHGLAAAVGLTEAVRGRGGTVVATGGCFDLLHAGHARTLRAARELGDCLVVCLNSDRSVRRLKGVGRPINRQRDRAELLGSLGCVDAVVIFDEDDPSRVLRRLRPDVWVKGGDYDPDSLPETELVRGWGGEVVVTPYLDGRSTTRIAGALHAIS